MTKRIVIIGATGAGKSTLANILAGKEPTDDLFPAGHKMRSMTHVTTTKSVKWRGKEDSFDLEIVDTPGLDDPEGKDDENMAAMIKELKTYAYVNLFLIVINGANVRLNRTMKDLLKIFRDMFGEQFLDNTMFEVTNWGFDRSSIRKRKNQNVKTTETWEDDLNQNLKEMKLRQSTSLPSKPIPAVFIDSLHDPEDENEVKEFDSNLRRLRFNLENASDFKCAHFQEAKREETKAKERAEELEREKEEAVQAKKEAEAKAKKAEEDTKKAEAAREEERQMREKKEKEHQQKLEEMETKTAALNHVSHVTQAVAAHDYSVKFQLTVENNTNHHLERPQYEVNGGYVKPAPTTIKPKCHGSMGGHKVGGCATGCAGAVAWDIGKTGKMLVVMYSAPYNFNFYSNTCGVSIFEKVSKNEKVSGFFDRMYNKPEDKNKFDRKEFYNTAKEASYSGGGFRVTATMGNSHHPLIQVSLHST